MKRKGVNSSSADSEIILTVKFDLFLFTVAVKMK